MKCPFCSELDNKVLDSRLTRNDSVIRRRRECISCHLRFTTYEVIEELPIMIIKKDGRRENFSREKVQSGIQKACEKRNISVIQIDEFIDQLECELRSLGEKEIPSTVIGEKVMAKLHEWDDVAFVRFASVYREFKDINDFMDELKKMLNTSGKQKSDAPSHPS